MNGKERISRILKRQPVDRIGLCEAFWSDTLKEYRRQGKMKEGEPFEDHFGLDLQICRPFNLTLDLSFEDEILEETDAVMVVKDGNGATLRKHKLHDTPSEHMDFSVKGPKDWDRVKHLLDGCDERRIDFEGYRKAKAAAEKAGRFFCCAEFGPFALTHPVSGHMHILTGMALEPQWVTEMAQAYAGLMIRLQALLFEREGYPDAVWYYDDLGFKQRSFMSPQMYKDIFFQSHKQVVDYAHAHGLPVILHSCGFIEPLIGHLVEAGFDCLQALEIKSGMDLLRIYKNFGDKIALMGGIDVRVLLTNDRQKIDAELESKIPIVKNGFGYILHSDHSIPKEIEYDTVKYYFQKGLELGKY